MKKQKASVDDQKESDLLVEMHRKSFSAELRGYSLCSDSVKSNVQL